MPSTSPGTARADIATRSSSFRPGSLVRSTSQAMVTPMTTSIRELAERHWNGEGDLVQVVETRPLSRLKRWRLVEILEKAK